MKNIHRRVRVQYPVQRPDVKRTWRKGSEQGKKAQALAAAVVGEFSGFSPLEKKVVALLEAKNTNKAQKILGKRMGSHRRALVKINKLTKMLLQE